MMGPDDLEDETENEAEGGRDETDEEARPRKALRRQKRGAKKDKAGGDSASGHPHLVIVIGGHRMMGSREKKRMRRGSRRG